jgi:hypothetical protein
VVVGGGGGVVVSAGRATVHECRLISLRTVDDPRGSLTFVEAERDVPFAIERVYYLHGVPERGRRGGHAHRELAEVLIAAAGGFDVLLDDGVDERRVRIDDPRMGLYLPAGIWRELESFAAGSLCLVLASMLYDPGEYIRDYDEFRAWRGDSG